MISKALLAVLLAAGAFLTGAAVSFCGLQTAMLASASGGGGDSSSSGGNPAGCEPAGFVLPVSLEVMHGIDAAVLSVVAAACVPAKNFIASMPSMDQRPVRNLVTGALYFGVLAPFPVLPACPPAPPSSAGAGSASSSPAGCGICTPFSHAVLRRVNVAAVAILAVACIPVYVNLATWTTRATRRHPPASPRSSDAA